MQQTGPIKRSAELTPLSREHHDGLLLCWKIRNGLSKQIEASRIVAYVVHFYETDLILHFRKEEEYLFTLLPATDPLRMKAEGEHRAIETCIKKLKEDKTPAAIILQECADLLDKHIRFEERELFPFTEQQTEPQKLQEAGVKIDTDGKQCETEWNDKFWLK